MSDELHHECGVAALYWLDQEQSAPGPASRAVADENVAALVPSMLLDLQNRGQLAAGLSSYNPRRMQILDTYKDVGTVAEAFRMSHPAKHQSILTEYAGKAAIGHTRYATCGADDARYAQPFERHHGRLWKWFTFAFNGNLANYTELRQRMLSRRLYHFTFNTDTEIVMHALAYALRGERPAALRNVMTALARMFDGAYNIVFMDGMGRMFVARDPLGLRPLSYAVQGRLFAAASESVALTNMGFHPDEIKSLDPGQMITIDRGRLRLERFASERRHAHCFFEWMYFSNVASTIDGSSVYMARARSGQKLAEMEDQHMNGDCMVVPVPDTAKAAADAFAYAKGVPCVEGLIRNRYVGRTFIQPSSTRGRSARGKYTPLPAVLKGKRVFLIEDSIVRSTTLASLVTRLRSEGGAREVHVRVACPPIVAPCFYGIDMSTMGELFAPRFVDKAYRGRLDKATLAKMAAALQVDSLKYLAVDDVGAALQIRGGSLCKGCILGQYRTSCGRKLLQAAQKNAAAGKSGRTYE